MNHRTQFNCTESKPSEQANCAERRQEGNKRVTEPLDARGRQLAAQVKLSR
jgi:hypothetical protein